MAQALWTLRKETRAPANLLRLAEAEARLAEELVKEARAQVSDTLGELCRGLPAKRALESFRVTAA